MGEWELSDMRAFIKTIFGVFIFSLVFSLFSARAAGQSSADMVDVVTPYARASLPGVSMGAAFMALKNNSGERRYLVSAESPAAAATEIHGHVMADGIIKMRKTTGIDLDASHTRLLQPGGFHIMLIGLKQPLQQGESFPLELIYRDGSRDKVTVLVIDGNVPE